MKRIQNTNRTTATENAGNKKKVKTTKLWKDKKL